ncbi:BT4734/BF3469 family protein [Rhodohalobacter sp. 8-1]|uniref:BT4734/BF3469 family protein n=1 Tax=Rhodohalobacter sp. 8-1 TaxID=3131972 RepID=UPI0030EF58E0
MKTNKNHSNLHGQDLSQSNQSDDSRNTSHIGAKASAMEPSLSNGISYFEAPITNTTPSDTVQIENVFDYIISNENAKQTTYEYRNCTPSNEKVSFKNRNFDFVTFSGQFNERSKDGIMTPSPYVCVDLDKIVEPTSVLEKVKKDPEYPLTMGFISPSGNGIKLVYRVDTSKGTHKEYYTMFSNHLSQQYGLEVDFSPSSVVSACYLPHDPNAYYDENCPTVSLPESYAVTDGKNDDSYKLERNQTTITEADKQLVEACVKHIVGNGLNITEAYDDWIKKGFALTELGEEGREYFHQISSASTKYNRQECDYRYTQLLKDSRGEITLGTFFNACKKHDVPVSELRRELPLLPLIAAPDLNTDNYDFTERETHEVRIDDELEEEQVCLGIFDSPLLFSDKKNKPCKIATLGNFSTWIGKAKSRKTFLISMFVAAALKGGRFQNQIHTEFPEDKRRVLVFDTEQGSNDVIRVKRRIANLADKDNQFMREHIKVFALRALTPKERLEEIEKMLAKHKDYGLVVIDGIRDLVSSINDEDQATMVSSKLLRWTQEYQIHIMGVLHMNKGDRNARGHLGTELVNKSESVISVTKNNETTSTVDPENMRGIEFRPFTFCVDENGLPHLSSTPAMFRNGLTKFTPGNISFAEHRKFLAGLFAEKKTMKHTDLWNSVYDKLGDKFDFGQSKAKEFPQWYVEQGLLSVKDDGNKKLYSLTDPD